MTENVCTYAPPNRQSYRRSRVQAGCVRTYTIVHAHWNDHEHLRYTAMLAFGGERSCHHHADDDNKLGNPVMDRYKWAEDYSGRQCTDEVCDAADDQCKNRLEDDYHLTIAVISQ